MKKLQIGLSDELYDEAKSVLNEIGTDMPTAIRLYLEKIVQTRSIPFTPKASEAQPLEVDETTQHNMDQIATAWNTADR